MLLDTISLGKAFRSGDAADKSMASPLEHFKNDDTSFLDEDEERIAKNLGQKHTFISHSSLPFDMAKKQFPYLALKGPLVFPSDSEDLTIETAQERRDAGEEENSAKLPIGRRDFDMLIITLAMYREAGNHPVYQQRRIGKAGSQALDDGPVPMSALWAVFQGLRQTAHGALLSSKPSAKTL
ncbi:hypothetical protein NDU88_004120 [Pleurodeles waltl]|uniref:Uncharacterized protein n=1 Tax=Pleurodeles waltl TaxID=8319 RepID=A0AAV7SHZ9_PLEWA|nr:hypothetical protein NDU88_004120 [Pleurodeles waltl]